MVPLPRDVSGGAARWLCPAAVGLCVALGAGFFPVRAPAAHCTADSDLRVEQALSARLESLVALTDDPDDARTFLMRHDLISEFALE